MNNQAKLPLDGIVTVLNTPFDAAGRVDVDALAAHARYALEAGVAGFLYPAIASEVSELSREERRAAVAGLAAAVDGAVPIVGGAWAAEQSGRVAWAQELADLGCAGVLVNITHETDEQYLADVEEIAAACPAWLMIQDWDPVGEGLPLDLIQRLYESVPSFRSLKIETVPAGPKYSAVRDMTGGQLHVAGGWAVTQMIEGLERGVDAFMPTGLHHAYVRIHRLYRAGDIAGAEAVFREVLPILAFSNQHLDISLHFFKRLLKAQGIYPTDTVRARTKPFDAVHARRADALLAEAMALEGRCAALNGGPAHLGENAHPGAT